ncbi:MAG TPA: hypothetical protein VNM69_16155 [Bacillus sp. (in: firmicutes)]|nr:hypothetical protein [Bacillus sp. (in: firmicutes)]
MRILHFALLVFLVGCSTYSQEFTVSGEITKIDKNLIFVDYLPIRYRHASDFEMGQRIKVTLIDRTSEDVWDYTDFTVKKIEIIE